tara:strand:- start:8139 stop:8936 length:798 start_codon:yes stop_codon:yes gene_type:complete
MTKVKIISGWSNPGGSTTAFINLCNLFNENNIDCTFYGPHPYHLGQCKSDVLENCAVNEEGEILISHFFKIPHRPEKSKKVILSCHEKDIFPIKTVKSYWDEIVYVSNSQMFWQGVPGTVIPNVLPVINRERKETPEKVAGIIGSIDINKNTHVSIQRALADNCDKVLLFGLVTNNPYWENQVKPLVDGSRVIFNGYVQNRDEIYSQIDVVYQSSKSECASLVSHECKALGIEFKGNKNIDKVTTLSSNSDILEKWKKVLDYDNW